MLLQINNAATSSNEMGANFEDAVAIMNTNYFGVKNVTKALLPLARNTPVLGLLLCHLELVYSR